MRNHKLITGLISVGIYIFVVGLLVFYFNVHNKNISKRFVKKDDHKIQISIATLSKRTQKPKKIHTKTHPKRIKPKSKIDKKKIIKKSKVRKKPKIKPKKRVIKSKKIVKNRDKNITKKQHRIKPTDLFANVKVTKKKPLVQITSKPIEPKSKQNLIKITSKLHLSAMQKINNSLKVQPNKNSGIRNEYLARVQEQLEDWPTQSDFAGQSVKVLLYIKPSGDFTFEIKSASSNLEFNQSLSKYLKQLQVIGFGRHEGSKTYVFEANFVAKE
jgi:protein TonB